MKPGWISEGTVKISVQVVLSSEPWILAPTKGLKPSNKSEPYLGLNFKDVSRSLKLSEKSNPTWHSDSPEDW